MWSVNAHEPYITPASVAAARGTMAAAIATPAAI